MPMADVCVAREFSFPCHIKENASDLRQGRFLLYGGEEDVLAIKANELKNKKHIAQWRSTLET
ncbi:hypothetical protein [Pectobacterium versatile]|uniref:hypothetical protein n=1 Tax=Pectobacterium versatile TaxID=2488639 RepID=UPI001CCB0FF9|nr:hypothetical protein [Pectobacterium versatile]